MKVSSDLDMQGFGKITNLPDPTSAQDIATKAYFLATPAATGATGAAYSGVLPALLYSGSGVPSNDNTEQDGRVGSFFRRSGTDNIYGPRAAQPTPPSTSQSWGSAVSLLGATGSTGATGEAGSGGGGTTPGSLKAVLRARIW